MKTIYKYILSITDDQKVLVPYDSTVLTCQMQNNQLCMWCLVNPSRNLGKLKIKIIGTGNPISDDLVNYEYVSTVQEEDRGLVLHIFKYYSILP
jgi:hypothetical protein